MRRALPGPAGPRGLPGSGGTGPTGPTGPAGSSVPTDAERILLDSTAFRLDGGGQGPQPALGALTQFALNYPCPAWLVGRFVELWPVGLFFVEAVSDPATGSYWVQCRRMIDLDWDLPDGAIINEIANVAIARPWRARVPLIPTGSGGTQPDIFGIAILPLAVDVSHLRGAIIDIRPWGIYKSLTHTVGNELRLQRLCYAPGDTFAGNLLIYNPETFSMSVVELDRSREIRYEPSNLNHDLIEITRGGAISYGIGDRTVGVRFRWQGMRRLIGMRFRPYFSTYPREVRCVLWKKGGGVWTASEEEQRIITGPLDQFVNFNSQTAQYGLIDGVILSVYDLSGSGKQFSNIRGDMWNVRPPLPRVLGPGLWECAHNYAAGNAAPETLGTEADGMYPIMPVFEW